MTPGVALLLLSGVVVSVGWGTDPTGWAEDSSSFHRSLPQPPPLASQGLPGFQAPRLARTPGVPGAQRRNTEL